MSAKHTPGPWSVREHGSAVYRGTKIVCRVNAASPNPQNMGADIEMAASNARLIAASPDLLDVVDALIKSFSSAGVIADLEGNDPAEWLLAKALQAHSKATGEAA